MSSGGVCPWVGVEAGGLVLCLLKGLTSKCITDRQQGPGAGVCPLTVEAELCLVPGYGGPGLAACLTCPGPGSLQPLGEAWAEALVGLAGPGEKGPTLFCPRPGLQPCARHGAQPWDGTLKHRRPWPPSFGVQNQVRVARISQGIYSSEGCLERSREEF